MISESARRWNASEEGKKWKREYMKKWRAKNPEKWGAIERRYRERNRDVIIARGKESYKRTYIPRTYGISKEKYESMCANGCAICGTHEKLHVDHCHATGKVRGILCSAHNTALGSFADNIDHLYAAISYLSGGDHGC